MTKIFIVGSDGGVPAEAQGMAKVLQFLAEIHDEGNDIDQILRQPDGNYRIHPHRLNSLMYNPKTGELSVIYVMVNYSPYNVDIPWCDKCYEGCGCKCQVDLGWIKPFRSDIPKSDAQHCRDDYLSD